jgi:hypothetical protein
MLKLLHEVGRSVAVLHDNALLFVYRYGVGWPKPHFHPLYAPDSTRVLTLHAPHDYVHHRGLMWSFGRVAPQERPDEWVNFWEERVRECDEDSRICWPRQLEAERRGTIRHVGFQTLEPGRDRALIVADHEWRRASDERVLLWQRQTVTTYPKTEAGWFFDVQFDLRAAGEPVLLAPHPTGDDSYPRTPYGLACQFSRELNDGVFLNSSGERGPGCCEQTATWCDYSSPLDDDESAMERGGGWVGLTIINHPGNPRHPSPFFAFAGSTTFLSATPVESEPLLVSSQAMRTFRYRLFAHHGRGDMSTLQRQAEAFAQTQAA